MESSKSSKKAFKFRIIFIINNVETGLEEAY